MIYTDNIHMVADSLQELHEFAFKIGLKLWFFHGVRKGHPHYDLTNELIRAKALEAGAIVVRSREILAKSKEMS
jgi:hypothetical protein